MLAVRFPEAPLDQQSAEKEQTSCPGFPTDLIVTSFAVRRAGCSAPLPPVSRAPLADFVRSHRE